MHQRHARSYSISSLFVMITFIAVVLGSIASQRRGSGEAPPAGLMAAAAVLSLVLGIGIGIAARGTVSGALIGGPIGFACGAASACILYNPPSLYLVGAGCALLIAVAYALRKRTTDN